jgi:hypothetical protein
MSALLAAVPPVEEEAPAIKYDFDEDFQSKIAALMVRSTTFAQRTDGLIRPEYLSNDGEAKLVALALDYYGKFKRVPADRAIYKRVVKEAIESRRLRKEDLVGMAGTLDKVFGRTSATRASWSTRWRRSRGTRRSPQQWRSRSRSSRSATSNSSRRSCRGRST